MANSTDKAIKVVTVAIVASAAAYLGYCAYKKRYPFDFLKEYTIVPTEEPEEVLVEVNEAEAQQTSSDSGKITGSQPIIIFKLS